MRALWLVRPDLGRVPGGDTTQIRETAEELRRIGVSVVLSSETQPTVGQFDIVHLFHLSRVWENARWCRLLQAGGTPAVLSPIFWPTDEFDRLGRTGLRGLLARCVGTSSYQSLRAMHGATLGALRQWDHRALLGSELRFERGAQFILASVDALLPNSHPEAAEILGRFDVRCPVVVVPNGVHPVVPPTLGGDSELPREGIICVGRIEPRKNQLRLIRALRDVDVPLSIVGRAGRLSSWYEFQCRREAGPQVRFLGQCTQAQLARLYRSSRVHVNTSWYETPGLASLEAAARGCSIVVTPGGSTREYFGHHAYYCEPNDPTSIRDAVERALASPPDDLLAKRINARFTWEEAARGTLRAYELALERRDILAATSSVEIRKSAAAGRPRAGLHRRVMGWLGRSGRREIFEPSRRPGTPR